MKVSLIGLVVAVAACSTTPPEGTIARVKHDARKTLIADCIQYPEQYGFPNTRAENADLLSVTPALAPNVYSYCKRVAQHQVR